MRTPPQTLFSVALGLVKALRAILVLTLFERKHTKGRLLMDGISVSPKMRGSGVGSSLLNQLIGYTRVEGYRTVRLDVIDTNPAARRLSERIGFVATKTARFGYMRWLLGFGAATTLEYGLHVGA